jgi:hypothetical protein
MTRGVIRSRATRTKFNLTIWMLTRTVRLGDQLARASKYTRL